MFECDHCHRTYINKRYYLKHIPSCKALLRKEEVKTVIGLNAFKYFKKYLNYKHCYNDDIEVFLNFRYYNCFIRFAKFVIDKKVPDIDLYIEFVNNRKILPIIWTSPIIYSAYIKYLDNLSPFESMKLSILSLKKLSKIFNCGIEDVLLTLYINEIIDLLYSRHISPWFLLNSVNINKILMDPNITKSQHTVLELFIKPDVWRTKFNNNRNEVIKIKNYLKTYNL